MFYFMFSVFKKANIFSYRSCMFKITFKFQIIFIFSNTGVSFPQYPLLVYYMDFVPQYI